MLGRLRAPAGPRGPPRAPVASNARGWCCTKHRIQKKTHRSHKASRTPRSICLSFSCLASRNKHFRTGETTIRSGEKQKRQRKQQQKRQRESFIANTRECGENRSRRNLKQQQQQQPNPRNPRRKSCCFVKMSSQPPQTPHDKVLAMYESSINKKEKDDDRFLNLAIWHRSIPSRSRSKGTSLDRIPSREKNGEACHCGSYPSKAAPAFQR